MSENRICPECGNPVEVGAKVCSQCGFPLENKSTSNSFESRNTGFPPVSGQDDNIWMEWLTSILHFLYRIVYLLFILPYDLWKRAVRRMTAQRKNQALEADKIKHELPFLVWLKRFVFDFVLDGIAILSWIIGVVYVIIGIANGYSFDFFEDLVMPLYAWYVMPLLMAIVRDVITYTIVMPIRWTLSFLRRPAKTYDLTHNDLTNKQGK